MRAKKKIDGYNTVIIARRAKSGEWQGAKKNLCVGEKTTGVNKACAGLTVRRAHKYNHTLLRRRKKR